VRASKYASARFGETIMRRRDGFARGALIRVNEKEELQFGPYDTRIGRRRKR
jgi:hypothetical protein